MLRTETMVLILVEGYGTPMESNNFYYKHKKYIFIFIIIIKNFNY